MDLSVVIPTRDRPGLLADCLRTLAAQKTSARVEVVVADDGSVEPLDPMVAQFSASPVSFRTVRLTGVGLNVARNRGVQATSADVIAFLDDDTLVSPDWCDGVLDGFRSLGCAGLAGRILLQYEGSRPGWLWIDEHGYLSGLDLGEVETLIDDGGVPVGANCAVTREWFNLVGGFKAGLDRNGTTLLSGGDTDFFRRILRAGGSIGYSPRALVRHRVPPERLTLRFFARRAISQGLSDALIEGRPRTLRESARWWLVTVQQVGRAPLVLVKNLLLRRGLLAPMTWSARCVGRLSALGYWRHSSDPKAT